MYASKSVINTTQPSFKIHWQTPDNCRQYQFVLFIPYITRVVFDKKYKDIEQLKRFVMAKVINIESVLRTLNHTLDND